MVRSLSSIRKESTLEGDCRNTIRCYLFLLKWKTPYTKIIRLITYDAVVEKRSHETQNMDGCNSDALIIGCGISASQLSEQKRTSFSYSAFHKKKRLDNSLTPLITHKKQPWQTDQIKHNYRLITRRASFLARNTVCFCHQMTLGQNVAGGYSLLTEPYSNSDSNAMDMTFFVQYSAYLFHFCGRCIDI